MTSDLGDNACPQEEGSSRPTTNATGMRKPVAVAVGLAATAAALARLPLRAQQAGPPSQGRLPPAPAPCSPRPRTMAATLDVADVRSSSTEEQLLFAALQGIVNSDGPRIY